MLSSKGKSLNKGEKINILKLTQKFKGKYSLKFTQKNGTITDCKISVIPIRLPCRPQDDLNLVVCYGFGNVPMMLITNLKSDDKRLSVAVVKVYLIFYAVADGLVALLAKYKQGINHMIFNSPKHPRLQLSIFGSQPFD